MDTQKILFDFYQEIANEDKWESKNWKVILQKGGLVIKSKLSDKQCELLINNK